MKRSICFISILAAVVCTASCTKEGSPDGTATNLQHMLSVNMDAGTFLDREGTKASMDAVVRATWDGTEKVSVINVTTGKLLGGQLEAIEGGASVTFTGTVTGSLTTGDKIVYVYPTIEENSSEKDFTKSKMDLSAQTYESDSRRVDFCGYAEDIYSGADGPGSEISRKIAFNLATSYVHLNMSQLPKGMDVNTVSVSSINDCFLWAIEDGEFVISKPDTENQGKIAVTCTDIRTSSVSGNAIVRFAVPEASPTSGRALTVNDIVHTADAASSCPAGLKTPFPQPVTLNFAFAGLKCGDFQPVIAGLTFLVIAGLTRNLLLGERCRLGGRHDTRSLPGMTPDRCPA